MYGLPKDIYESKSNAILIIAFRRYATSFIYIPRHPPHTQNLHFII